MPFKRSLPFGVSSQYCMCISVFPPRAWHVPRQAHLPWRENPNRVWWRVLIAKLLITQISPSSLYLLPPHRCILQHPANVLPFMLQYKTANQLHGVRSSRKGRLLPSFFTCRQGAHHCAPLWASRTGLLPHRLRYLFAIRFNIHINSWVKRDQLDVTCFIISLLNAQHVYDVNTSILRSLRLICWVISWVVLLCFDVCWCYVVVWLGWCGICMQAEASASACIQIPYWHQSDIKLVSLYSTIKMMHGPINIRFISIFMIFNIAALLSATMLPTLFSIADLHSSTMHRKRIVAFPCKEWLCERATFLRCT